MPVGPPYGGMTTYTRMLRCSPLFADEKAILFDTTPPTESGRVRRGFNSLVKLGVLMAAARRNRAKVIYFMTSDYLGFYEKSTLALCCRLFGVQTVLHPVGSFVSFYREAAGCRWVIRFLLRRQSAIVVVQRQVQSYIAQLAPQTPVWLIPNPVDCSQFAPGSFSRPSDGIVRILFIGTLTTKKGVLDLLDAVRLNRAELRRALVTIVGEGELHAECQRRIAAFGLDTVVEMKGFVDEMAKVRFLATSDIFCLPSHSEGTPISVLEAMAAGMPIVATNVGGIPWVVQHGREGWLAVPGDVAGIGRLLVHLVRHEAVRRMMGRNALRRVQEQFNINTVADQFISKFNELADTNHRLLPSLVECPGVTQATGRL